MDCSRPYLSWDMVYRRQGRDLSRSRGPGKLTGFPNLELTRAVA